MNLNRSKKSVLVTVCIVLVSVIAVGSTVAFIMAKTGALTNIFSPGEVKIQYNNNTVTNIGDADVYVRMTYVVTLVKSNDPNIYLGSQKFDDQSYTVDAINMPSDWIEGADGIYYYTGILQKGDALSTFPTVDITPASGYVIPNGYEMKVQYLFSAIQAKPVDALEIWQNSGGFSIGSDGTLSKP